MCVQLPELHPHLSHRLHHILLYQRLRLHGDQMPARRGECVFALNCFALHVGGIFCITASLQVCVVGDVVHSVGKQWDEGCERCSCTQLQDKDTLLHIAQCTPPVCERTCPPVRHTHPHAQTHSKDTPLDSL